MQLPGLDVSQSRAFVFEVNATKNTLACGLRLLSTDALTDNTRDPIMVLLSVGLERLHKLTLGVISVADSGHWDDSKAHKHRLSTMHHDVLEAISHRVTSPYVEELLRATRSDALLDAVIACADSFAREGRYSYLDALSGGQQRATNPDAAWRMVEEVAEQRADVAARRQPALKAPTDNALWTAASIARGAAISQSVASLWDFIATCGAHGSLGDLGTRLGADIKRRSVGRQT